MPTYTIQGHEYTFSEDLPPAELQGAIDSIYNTPEGKEPSALGEFVGAGKKGFAQVAEIPAHAADFLGHITNRPDIQETARGYEKGLEDFQASIQTVERQKLFGSDSIYEDAGGGIEGVKASFRGMFDVGRVAAGIGELGASYAIPAAAALGTFAVTRNPSAAKVAAGVTGGLLEGASTYEDIREETGDYSKAAGAGAAMTFGSGVLNTIGFEAMTSQLAKKGLLGKVGGALIGSTVETGTEILEELYEGGIREGLELPVDWKERFLAIPNMGLAMPLVGFAGSFVGQSSPADPVETVEGPPPIPIAETPEEFQRLTKAAELGHTNPQEAMDLLNKIPTLSLSELEKETLITVGSSNSFQDIVKVLDKDRKTALTEIDVAMLLSAVQGRKEPIFSNATTLEAALREEGFALEGDEFESAFDDELREKIGILLPGKGDEEIGVTVALLDNMIRNVTKGLNITPQQFVDQNLFDIKRGSLEMSTLEMQGLLQSAKVFQNMPDTKVVKKVESGESFPQLVFHASDTLGNNRPSQEFRGATDRGWHGTGIYFSIEANDSAGYQNGVQARHDKEGNQIAPGSVTTAVYLNITNPLLFRDQSTQEFRTATNTALQDIYGRDAKQIPARQRARTEFGAAKAITGPYDSRYMEGTVEEVFAQVGDIMKGKVIEENTEAILHSLGILRDSTDPVEDALVHGILQGVARDVEIVLNAGNIIDGRVLSGIIKDIELDPNVSVAVSELEKLKKTLSDLDWQWRDNARAVFESMDFDGVFNDTERVAWHERQIIHPNDMQPMLSGKTVETKEGDKIDLEVFGLYERKIARMTLRAVNIARNKAFLAKPRIVERETGIRNVPTELREGINDTELIEAFGTDLVTHHKILTILEREGRIERTANGDIRHLTYTDGTFNIHEGSPTRKPSEKGLLNLISSEGKLLNQIGQAKGAAAQIQRIDSNTGKAIDILKPTNNAVKYLIRGFEQSNFTTAIHEFTHFFALSAQGNFKGVLDKVYNKSVDTWTEKQHENFAYGFEWWILHGQEKNQDLNSAFRWVREYMRNAPTLFRKFQAEEHSEFDTAFEILFYGDRNTGASELQLADAVNKTLEPIAEGPDGTFIPTMALEQGWAKSLVKRMFGSGRPAANVSIPENIDPRQEEPANIVANDPLGILDILNKFNKGFHINSSQVASLGYVDAVIRHGDELLSGLGFTAADVSAYRSYASTIGDVYLKVGSESGKNLHAIKLASDQKRLFGIQENIRKGEWRNLTLLEQSVVKQALNSNDPSELAAVVRHLERTKDSNIQWGEIIKQLYYAGMLSSPTTHFVNIVGNLAWGSYLIAHNSAVGSVELLFSMVNHNYIPRHSPTSALHMLRGAVRASVDKKTWSLVREGISGNWSSEEAQRVLTRWDNELGYGGIRDGEKVIDPIANALGGSKKAQNVSWGLTAPLKFLVAADVWFKAVAENAFDEQANAHIGTFFNRKGEVKNQTNFDAFTVQFVRENLLNLRIGDKARALIGIERGFDVETLTDAQILADRQKYMHAAISNGRAVHAENSTFQTPPGAFTKRFIQARNSVPFGMGRFFVPFVATVSNIAKRGMEMTPGVGILLEAGNKVHSGNSSLTLADLTTKQIEGSIIAMMVLGYIQEGLLTGPPPEDNKERQLFYASGKRPFSMLVNGVWVDYRRYDPFGLPIGVVASIWDKFLVAERNGEEVKAHELFGRAALATKEYIINSTYMEGVGKALEGDGYDVQQQVAWSLSSLVPYSGTWRTANRSYEAYHKGAIDYNERTFMSTFGQNIPKFVTNELVEQGLIAANEPRLNAMGDKIQRNAHWFLEWMPMRYQIVGNIDKVEQELQAVSVYPSIPGDRITWNKRRGAEKMPDAFYKEYLIERGTKTKDAFNRLVSQRSWDDRSRDSKIRALKKAQDRVGSTELRRIKSKLRAAERRREI